MEKKNDIIFTVLCCILIVIFCIALCPVTLQNDTYYTIKIGEYIMQNGLSVVQERIEPFAWYTGLDYTYPHCGYDVMMYNIFNLGGFLGIYISTLVFTGILGLSIFFVNSKLTKNKLTSFIITLAVMYIIKEYIAARAQLFTFILFIWEIYFIETFLKTGKKKFAIPLLIIPLIIANVHVAVWPFYFVLYLPYIGEYILAYLADIGMYYRKWEIKRIKNKLKAGKIKEDQVEKIELRLRRLEVKNSISIQKNGERRKHPYRIKVEKNKNVKMLIIIMAICVLTGLLTPLGDTPYNYLIKTIQGNTMDNISEHLPLTLTDFKEFLCLLIVIFAIMIFTDTKVKLSDFFMMTGLLYLAFISRRQISMFTIICSVILNRMICVIFDKYDSEVCKRMKNKIVTLPGIIITTWLILEISLSIIKPKLNEKFVSESTYPVAASDYILENIDLKTMRIYNEYNYGSYLIYRGIPVFIDSRAELYTPQFNEGQDIFSDYINVSNINTYYEDKFEAYKITHVMVYKNSKLNMFLSRNNKYKLLYSDDYFYFYERLTDNE